jgi:hypothetical protein
MSNKKTPKFTTVSKGTLAAVRAHRTMIVKQMFGMTRAVRADLTAKVAAYDRRLAAMKVAA